MRSVGIGFGVALGGLLLAGCAATADKPDPKVELHKARGERDELARRLGDEQARTAALQRRLEVEQDEWNAAKAKVARLTESVDTLTQTNQELQRVLEDRKSRPLQRPAVPPSPLPAEIDQALRSFVAKHADRVWYERGRGAVSFANDRLFDSGSDVVRPEAVAALQELAGVLARTPADEYEIIIVGHTDDSPITKPETLARHPSNWHLSAHRAIAVQDVLARAGLSADRLGVMGYGSQRPVSADAARNRRVEVFVVRKGAVQSLEPVQPSRTRR